MQLDLLPAVGDARGIGKAEQFYFDCVVAGTADQWDISYRIPLSDNSFRYLRSVGARTLDGSITGIVCDITTDTLLTQSLSQAKENSDIKNAELELALEELSSREHQLAEASQRLDLALQLTQLAFQIALLRVFWLLRRTGPAAWAALGLFMWGTFVVSWVDNIIRPLVISNATRIPFLIVMFGVLGGLAAFGMVGLFLGPVILAVMVAVWREWLESANTPVPRDGSATDE